MPYKTHVVLEVDSAERSRGVPGNFELLLKRHITFNKQRQYFMRLENIRVPISYYNINSTNNVFRVEEDNGVSQTVIVATIPQGNYIISELLDELETQLNAATTQSNTYTLNKSNITGKVSISFTGGSTTITVQTITSGSTLNTILGFEDATYSTTDSVILVAPNHALLSPIRYLLIESSITSSNYYSVNHQKRIGVKVPVIELRENVQLFLNDNGPRFKVDNYHSLHKLDFRVVDNLGNQIDFNGVDYSFELVIYEWRD